jgi:mycothiol S-conjugate amidase
MSLLSEHFVPSSPLRLLTVHAHPDDESSKGSATVAMYTAAGVYSSLICCTGGELGDIANPAMDLPEVRSNLGEVRAKELASAVSIIGFSEVVMLGYRDSGMAGSEGNADPTCFHQADRDEAVARLVGIMRRVRPQVVITYGDDQQGYPHPDHLAVHDVSIPAFERCGDSEYRPELGEAWTPLKMYYSAWSRGRITAVHQRFLDLGIESPYDAGWFERPSHDHRITTRINIKDWYHVRSNALKAHATQIDPTSKFWFGLPDSELADAYPYDDFVLARSNLAHVPVRPPANEGDVDIWEDDLFAGCRD